MLIRGICPVRADSRPNDRVPRRTVALFEIHRSAWKSKSPLTGASALVQRDSMARPSQHPALTGSSSSTPGGTRVLGQARPLCCRMCRRIRGVRSKTIDTPTSHAVKWDIPCISGDSLTISLQRGGHIFIVGPNGSGKSALIQDLVSEYQGQNIRRISAHRQSWLDSGSLNLTPLGRRQFEENSTNRERNFEARWRDHDSQQKQSAVLFDLVAKENTRARGIATLVDGKDLEGASKRAAESVSAFVQLNDLLSLGTLLITLENSKDEEILAKHRDGDASYSIAQMSDGERNAAIIGATVLTVEPGTVLLIDEPERHLHRSIIVPFLAALFARREDCTFIVSTHELSLPAANPTAGVILVRSCEWENNRAKAWDIDLLESNDRVPEDLRLAILGSRRKVLFFEGTGTSLDLPIYSALFPDISVVASGTSTDVQRAVGGMLGSYDLHHVDAYGLIDSDGHPQEVLEALRDRCVFALDSFSVESLYYCSESLEAVARRQAETLGRQPETMVQSALKAAFDALAEDELAERMAARRCEHIVRNQITSHAPDWRTIRNEALSDFKISLPSPFQQELARFRELLAAKDFDQLVARYPLRESGVFGEVARALEFKRRELYEQTVIARVQSDPLLAENLRRHVGPLSKALGTGTTTPMDESDSTQ